MIGEGNHITQTYPAASRTQKVVWYVAGILGLLLIAAIGFQVYRTETGNAGVNPTESGLSDGAGQARLREKAKPEQLVANVKFADFKRQITFDEVAAECFDRIGQEVLEALINRTIIELACQEQRVTVTAAEVDQEIIRIAKDFDLDAEAWLKFLYDERNMTPHQYRRDIIWPMLALKRLAGETVTITDAELQQAFLKHYGPKVKARMIMSDKLSRAQSVWRMAMKEPAEFERLAREYSTDPNSRTLDGMIPPISRYSGSNELEEAAFKLRDGEISGIIQIGVGNYVILKCEGQTEQVVQGIDDVREALYHDLEKEKIQESVARIFEKLKKSTRIDNYLTNTTSGDIQQTSGKGSGRVRQADGSAAPESGNAPSRFPARATESKTP